MATTWPTRAADSVLSGEGAETLLLALYQRLMCIMRRGTTVGFGDATDAGGSYSPGTSVTVTVPGYVRSGMKIKIWAKGTRTAGTTAYYRAAETGGPTNGTEQSTTSTVGEWLASEITVPDNTWADADKTFELQAKGDGSSTSTVSVAKGACFWQVTD